MTKPSVTERPIPDVARQIGAHYLEADNTPTNAGVVLAYRHLQIETDALFHAATGDHSPGCVRVVFTYCRNPYSSDRELIAAVRSNRLLEITTAATCSEPLHPLLSCEFGGAFDRFRAVHDLIGHARSGLGFGLLDELAAWRTQDRLHGGFARRALATEILAVNCARALLGAPPEQKAMILDQDSVRQARDPRFFSQADQGRRDA
jgi:hypothetical protein